MTRAMPGPASLCGILPGEYRLAEKRMRALRQSGQAALIHGINAGVTLLTYKEKTIDLSRVYPQTVNAYTVLQ